jgi:hypothetical protein
MTEEITNIILLIIIIRIIIIVKTKLFTYMFTQPKGQTK